MQNSGEPETLLGFVGFLCAGLNVSQTDPRIPACARPLLARPRSAAAGRERGALNAAQGCSEGFSCASAAAGKQTNGGSAACEILPEASGLGERGFLRCRRGSVAYRPGTQGRGVANGAACQKGEAAVSCSPRYLRRAKGLVSWRLARGKTVRDHVQFQFKTSFLLHHFFGIHSAKWFRGLQNLHQSLFHFSHENPSFCTVLISYVILTPLILITIVIIDF